MSLNSKFLRVFSVVADSYGIDPLLDKMIPQILSISNYTMHKVTQDERGAPDLIAFREYGTEEMWWHVCTYNGIPYKRIVEGISLKIPSYSDLTRIVSQSAMQNSVIPRVINI